MGRGYEGPMKKAHRVWKVAAVLFVAIVAVGMVVAITAERVSPLKLLENVALILAAAGLLQYAFGPPRLPLLVWRVFGPLFSLVLLLGVARAIGWLGTRLAIRPLSGPELAGTAFLIVMLLGYALIIVIPLYRLGQWKYLRSDPQSEETAALQDSFA
jgi:hypothetical protein